MIQLLVDKELMLKQPEYTNRLQPTVDEPFVCDVIKDHACGTIT
jgi:hypothetical protein